MTDIITSWPTPIVRDHKFFDNQQEIINLARTHTTLDDKSNNKFTGGIPFLENLEIKEFKDWVLLSVYDVAKQVNRWKKDHKPEFIDMWSWSSTDYDNPLHGHHNCSWSGIYCLEEGDTNSVEGYNGSTLMFSPLPWGQYVDPGNRFLEDQFLSWHQLTAGDLLLFPSYVRHSAKYKGTTPRTIIAFNIVFK